MLRNPFGFPQKLYKESRRSLRVKEKVSIKWMIGGIGSGFGSVCDLSTTGALIDAKQPIMDGAVISFDQGGSVLPSQGRVVWSKPKGWFQKGCLCGVEFIDTSAEAMDRLKQRIEQRILTLNRTEVLLSIATIILVGTMLALGGLVMFQRASVARTLEASNAAMLSTSFQQAKLYQDLMVRAHRVEDLYINLQLEYFSTRIILAQTESLLAEAQRQYAQSQEEILGLQSALSKAQTDNLADNVQVLVSQRDGLREELRSLQEEINLMAAQSPEAWNAQALGYGHKLDAIDVQMKNLKYDTLLARINEQKKEISAARQRMSELRRQASLARRDAQHRRDEIALTQGNRGFLLKDGKVPGKAVMTSTETPAKKVNIDVSFF